MKLPRNDGSPILSGGIVRSVPGGVRTGEQVQIEKDESWNVGFDVGTTL